MLFRSVGPELLRAWLSWEPLGQNGSRIFPGMIFGALVLAPQVVAASHRWGRRLGLLATSISIYYLAVELGLFQVLKLNYPETVAGTVSGAFGAAATWLAVRVLVPMTLSLASLRQVAIVGALGGAVFVMSVASLPKFADAIPPILGFLIWQVGVAYVLFAPRRAR